MHRKRLFGSVARDPCVLRGFGRGAAVAGRPGGAGLWSRWPAGSPRGASGGPGGSLGLRCGPQGAPQKGTVLSRVIVLGVLWCPLGCLGGSRAVRVTLCLLRGPPGCSRSCPVGPRSASAGSRGCCWGFSAFLAFGGEAPGGIQKQLKASQGLVVCSVLLSLGLSLGLPGRVSVHLALCRSVALCRFLPLCPVF